MVWNVHNSQLQIKTTFPHPVRVIEHSWIPMPDGARLAARIWLPANAEQQPVPALLEYIPYRKNDFTAVRDSLRHPYFAGHGYACVRVDMRGSGDSDGLLLGEYLQQEQDDAVAVIAWLAQQPWCNGAVGMFGKSWGGFNALQVAARRPPALKAIITYCSTDDRYADDVHYMGGCLLASDMLWWASYMFAWNGRPPDPQVVGAGWREQWLERLAQTPPYVEKWVRHQRRDAFWQHGSVCQNYADIECAVFAVGGWSDGYTNAIPRLLANLPGPKLGLIGPWAHEYPEVAIPGPTIGFLQEALRWWDHWLKGAETGIMNEPQLRAWLQASDAPATYYTNRPGRWVAEPAWPAPSGQEQRYYLRDSDLVTSNQDSVIRGSAVTTDHCPLTTDHWQIPSVQTHGLYAGMWCPFGSVGDWPSDQRAEDGLAACFTAEPVMAPQDVLGFPQAVLTLSADKPVALVAVRLCDIAPDGASSLVSWGLLNLTHRESHAEPTPLEPGQHYTVTVQLNAIGYTLLPGHRWRLAVAPTYWPHAWPSPEPVTLTLYPGEQTYLALPIRPAHPEEAAVHFEQPEISAVLARETLRPEQRTRTIQHDLNSGLTTLVDYADQGLTRLTDSGLEFGSILNDTFAIRAGDPLTATVRCERSTTVARGSWRTRIDTVSTMSADATHFHLSNVLEAFEGEVRVFTKAWSCAIPRDLG